MSDVPAAITSSAGSEKNLFIESAKQLPSAAQELVFEAWDSPWETTKHVVKSVGTAALGGAMLGAALPSRGPAALLAGVAFTAPILIGEYSRYKQASNSFYSTGANHDFVAREYAKGTLRNTGELGVGFVAGGVGAHYGNRLAASETVAGSALQGTQRRVLSTENSALQAMSSLPSKFFKSNNAAIADAPMASAPWFAPGSKLMAQRIAQSEPVVAGRAPRFKEYYGDLHAHSAFSDGMGRPKELYQIAKEGGKDFYSVTDHNHLAARDGVKPGDPRGKDQADVPIVAADPKEYHQTFLDAKSVSKDGSFVGLVGLEMGTIGKVKVLRSDARPPQNAIAAEVPGHVEGHAHDHGQMGMTQAGEPYQLLRVKQPDGSIAEHQYKFEPVSPGASRGISGAQPLDGPRYVHDHSQPSGVNHTLLYETPAFFEAVRRARTEAPIGRFLDGTADGISGKAQMPDVVKYNDGDYKALMAHLARVKDTMDQPAVMSFAHPRSEGVAQDYGRLSFKNDKEWVREVGKHASLIEVISGQALNPKTTDHMKVTDLSPDALARYTDLGFKLGPTFGRDDHFGMPNARPAGTGILAPRLDKVSVLDALRQRRTMATTSVERLRGHMVVNDKLPMGSVIDQNAVNSLNITMRVSGELHPEATYKVSLYGDKKIGDGKLAEPVQVRELSGQDLLDTQGAVAFDTVKHRLGAKSAYYVEVQRVDPKTNNRDYMWTAPVWIEPLAGSHSYLTRGIIGTGSEYLIR